MMHERAILAIRFLLTALALAMMPLSASAQSPGTSQLAGWWISIDETGLKPLWERGVIVPMEELLIVDDQGRFENRMMGFWSIDREYCSTGGVCSDAPLVATGRFSLSAGALDVQDFRATDTRIDSARTDPDIRVRAISSTRSWPVSRFDATEGTLALRKGTGHETRIFFKVEPDRLRRLRAGLMVAGLTATRHWRCFIAAATSAAFPTPGFRSAAPLPPLIRDYIKVASYLQTSVEQGMRPMPDDADPAQRKLAAIATEELMAERFDALPLPKTLQERRASMAAMKYLTSIAGGQPPDVAKAAIERDFPNLDALRQFSANELAALALLQSDSSEAKRIFCNP
jgi:hypothetical protein